MKKQKIIAAFTAFLMSFGAAQTSNYSPGIFTASAASSAETVSDTSPAVQAADKYTLGDINDDGYIDAVDASSVLSYYAKISTRSDGRFSNRQKMAADYNSDGLINAVDASQVLSFYAYKATSGTMEFEAYLKNPPATTTRATTTATTAADSLRRLK